MVNKIGEALKRRPSEKWRVRVLWGTNIAAFLFMGVMAWMLGRDSYTGAFGASERGYWAGGLITGILAGSVYWMLWMMGWELVKRLVVRHRERRQRRLDTPSPGEALKEEQNG